MDTYFASPERSDEKELEYEVRLVSMNPIADELMRSVGGFFAVLNQSRQIVALNDVFLGALSMDDPRAAFGLRPGEALHCKYSHKMPAGCGTSEMCATCGAAIAMVTCQTSGCPVEKTCSLELENGGAPKDMFFRVRCSPMVMEKENFLLLFLQDITYQQRLAGLERVFFHDIGNVISGLLSMAYVASQRKDGDTAEINQTIYRITMRLAQEFAMQRHLNYSETSTYRPLMELVQIRAIFQEIRDLFTNHPAAVLKTIVFPEDLPDTVIWTDQAIAMRVVNNMVINALEATDEGGSIRLMCELGDDRLKVSVWNRKAIPPEIQKRIFHRNFSTSEETGRGFGTYSMRHFGEEVLGGKVEFCSSDTDGTLFSFSLKR